MTDKTESLGKLAQHNKALDSGVTVNVAPGVSLCSLTCPFYADDFVILVRSPRAGKRVMRSIRGFLEKKLKLKVNEQKSSVASTDQITFLGFAFKREE